MNDAKDDAHIHYIFWGTASEKTRLGGEIAECTQYHWGTHRADGSRGEAGEERQRGTTRRPGNHRSRVSKRNPTHHGQATSPAPNLRRDPPTDRRAQGLNPNRTPAACHASLSLSRSQEDKPTKSSQRTQKDKTPAQVVGTYRHYHLIKLWLKDIVFHLFCSYIQIMQLCN